MYHKRMYSGNSKSAIYWAKYVKYHAPEDYDVYACLGAAYELDKQYEKALENYAVPKRNGIGPGNYAYRYKYSGRIEALLDIPRVEYKFNRKKEAFFGYCQYADICLEKYQKPLEEKQKDDRNLALANIRRPITMEQSPALMRLNPFLDYKIFLDFVEEEYQKLGEPPEYAAAMELFRAIDTEIDEKHLPRSGASAQLEAMRAKILAERKAKGVKW